MPTGFTPMQKSSLRRAVFWCAGALTDEEMEGIYGLMDKDSCTWGECSRLCDAVFMIAYGLKNLLEIDREKALKDAQHEIRKILANNI